MARSRPVKNPHFSIGRNIDGKGVFAEADIDPLQPSENELKKGKTKRRIEVLREKYELLEDLTEVWYR